MREIKTMAYQFEELSDQSKNTAIEEYRTAQYKYEYEGEILPFFNEDCEEQAKEEGFESPKFQYSLSYSQGDGLSFSADNYSKTKLESLFNKYLGKGKKETAKLLADNCSITIRGNDGNYPYASKSDIDAYLENHTSGINVIDTECIDNIISLVLSDLEDIYMELCAKLEKQGYNEIEHKSSDEYITEEIEDNEYEFTEDGNRI